MPEILGVKIDNVNRQEAVGTAKGFLVNGRQNLIFTPNPEMIVDAQNDAYFKKVLNFGDLNISDGFGVSLISLGYINRIPGVDFLIDICAIAEYNNKSVFLLGSGSKDVLKAASENLTKKFPKLKIVGFHPGPKIDFVTIEDEVKIVPEQNNNDQAIHEIIMAAPDILLVAFGHNKQEKWIYENIKDFPTVKIAMGVGGAFDFLAGFNYEGKKVRRAPCFMRKIGLEWLYRVITQPYRIKRILKATLYFVSLNILKTDKK